MSIQSSIDTLKLENDELSLTINALRKVEQERKEDMAILKSTICIVGENADDMISNLSNTHDKEKINNNRNVLSIQFQTSSQLMQVFNHFDNDQNLALEEIELKCAKQSISNLLAYLNWDGFTSRIKNK